MPTPEDQGIDELLDDAASDVDFSTGAPTVDALLDEASAGVTFGGAPDGPPQQTSGGESHTLENSLLALSQGMSGNLGDDVADIADSLGYNKAARWTQDHLMPDFLGGTGSHFRGGEPYYTGLRPETPRQMHDRASNSPEGKLAKLGGNMLLGVGAGGAMAGSSIASQALGNAALAGITEYADSPEATSWDWDEQLENLKRSGKSAAWALGLGTVGATLAKGGGALVKALRGGPADEAAPYALGELETAALPESTGDDMAAMSALPEPAPASVRTLPPPAPVGVADDAARALPASTVPDEALGMSVPSAAPVADAELMSLAREPLPSEPFRPYRPQRYGDADPLSAFANETPALDVPAPIPRGVLSPPSKAIRGKGGKFLKVPGLDTSPLPAPSGGIPEPAPEPYALGDVEVDPLAALGAPRVGGPVPLAPEPSAPAPTTAAGYALGDLDYSPTPVASAPKTRAALPWEPAKPLPVPDLPMSVPTPEPYTPNFGTVTPETSSTMALYADARAQLPEVMLDKIPESGKIDKIAQKLMGAGIGRLFGSDVLTAIALLDDGKLTSGMAQKMRQKLPTEARIEQIVSGFGGAVAHGASSERVQQKAYGDRYTMNHAVETSVRAIGDKALTPQRLQGLTAAIASHDKGKLDAELFKAQQESPAFRKHLEETLKSVGSE